MDETNNLWHANTSRKIISRIIIEGEMQLQTPTALGGGNSSDLTDMPLLVDLQDGKSPLLPGSTLAGALRSALRARELGYLISDLGTQEWETVAQTLFGGEYSVYENEVRSRVERVVLMDQSSVLIDDALGNAPAIEPTEQRFGVKIEAETRTAADDKLFDTQLWAAGTTFPLRLQLIIRQGDDADALKQGLATALAGLSNGLIVLGGRKRRGYGDVHVAEWFVKTYDLTTVSGLLDWLEKGDVPLSAQKGIQPLADIYQAMKTSALPTNKLYHFDWSATFSLDGSLLIRTANSQGEQVADFVHLQSRQVEGQTVPILSGTSLAGVLRARALKIANTLDKKKQAKTFVYQMFGPDMDDSDWAKTQGEQKVAPQASRLLVRETVVKEGIANLVQNRVSIDRFTGGARDTALFNEQPVWGKPETRLKIDLRLINPSDADIGLLLLLLKDLWTGDLPVGGESSVGRGRLQGKCATLTLGETVWQIEAGENGRLQFSGNGSQTELQEKYLNAFLKEVGHGS